MRHAAFVRAGQHVLMGENFVLHLHVWLVWLLDPWRRKKKRESEQQQSLQVPVVQRPSLIKHHGGTCLSIFLAWIWHAACYFHTVNYLDVNAEYKGPQLGWRDARCGAAAADGGHRHGPTQPAAAGGDQRHVVDGQGRKEMPRMSKCQKRFVSHGLFSIFLHIYHFCFRKGSRNHDS